MGLQEEMKHLPKVQDPDDLLIEEGKITSEKLTEKIFGVNL